MQCMAHHRGSMIHLMSVQTRTMTLFKRLRDVLDHVSLKKEKATRNSIFIIGLKKIALLKQSSLLTKMRIQGDGAEYDFVGAWFIKALSQK